MGKRLSDRGLLALFTAGHIVDDIYMNSLPPLLPVLIANSGLSFTSAGLLVTLFTFTSSVSQPFLGYAIDRYRVRWIGALGLLWAGVFFGLMGMVRGYALLLALATFAGIGPAMFHPHALSCVSGISSGGRGKIMAIFIIGGNIGFALGPLAVGILTSLAGVGGMAYMAAPGVLMGLLIWRLSGRLGSEAGKEMHPIRLGDFKPAVLLIVVAILRSWVYFSILSYMPSYLVSLGSSVLRSNSLLSLMLLAGVAGQFAGGSFSDKIGRREVTMFSLLLSAPLLYAFLHTSGAAATTFLFSFGFTVMASFSVTLVMMHEIITRHIGTGSGIMIGLALGIGGLGVMITGLIADAFGIRTALHTLIAVLLLAGALARCIPLREV
jgi:FSR family fosmidomycin resistance protein-like MFS transporter